MRSAMIDINTNIVVGVIMADASVDLPPKDTFLINLPDDSPVGIDWLYDPSTQQFTNPLVGA
jgi:hypothetical protein